MKRAFWSLFHTVLFANAVFLGCYAQAPLFEALVPQKTGVQFMNILNETLKSNVLTYEYFYNGGGAAIGDFNNDGLDDLYFTGNMQPNALYINQGEFKFKEMAA